MIQKRFYLLCLVGFWTIALLRVPLFAQRFDWAAQSTTSGGAGALAVAIGAQGEVITVGNFMTSTDLDPGPGTFVVTGSATGSNAYIQALTASGSFLWGAAIQTTTGQAHARSVEVDPLGNIVVVGAISGTVDLDIGTGTDLHTVSTQGIFIVRISPSGGYLGGTSIDQPSLQYDNGSVLALDGVNGIYVVANFIDSVALSPGVVLHDSGTGDVFLARFDSSLNYVWHTHLGSPLQELGFCVATDANGVVIGARLMDPVDVDPGPATVLVGSTTAASGLVARYSHAGAYEWASVFVNTTFGDVMLMGIAVTPSRDILVTGQFYGTMDMDPGPGTTFISSPASDDVVIARLSSTGALEWARSMGGNNPDMGRNIVTDTAGNAYVEVLYYSAMDMDPGPGIYQATLPTPANVLDAAVVKLDSLGDFVWAGILTGSGSEGLGDLTVDAAGEVFGVGGFENAFDADPSPTATYVLNTPVHGESFIFAWRQDSCTDLRMRLDSVAGLNCTVNQGTAFTHAAGGLPPYSYAWSTIPPDLDSICTVASAGLYTVTVKDSRNCVDAAQVFIPGPSTNGYDLQINLVAAAFRPGVTTNLTLDAFNAGCAPISGQVKLKLSPFTTLVAANPAATLIAPDTLSWSFAAMNLDSGHFVIQLSLQTAITANIGDTIHLPLVITPTAGDDSPMDNLREDYSFPVQNSLDPNRIDVYPPGECTEHYVLSGTPLTYTVQFQNTGNAEALEVEILDTLPLTLNPQSFTLLGSSHTVVASFVEDQVLALTFHDIHLPDSTSNEPASHGYALFRVMPRPSLPSGTIIANRAAIYFDYNPPVITNAARVTMVDVIPACAVGVAPVQTSETIHLYPNPTTEAFWITGLTEDTQLRVVDLCGRTIWSGQALAGQPLKVSVTGWAQGLYWLDAGREGLRLQVR
ncbi:MAG: hypothetical protein IPN95_09725 [Bacteroidetes bacterium]|nr:hypothetical protein [Bacteroidota bacterium]